MDSDSSRSTGDTSSGSDYQLRGRDSLLVLAFAAALLGFALGSARVLTHHEIMFAEPAREMLATGDWLTPRIAGIPFNDKPPLTAWTIAAAMWLFGSQSEWIVRLPTFLAGVATAWMISATAARWWGRRIGIVAGMIQASVFYAQMQARLAEADMPLCAYITAAMCSLAWANIDSPRGRATGRWWPPIFYIATALAMLTKGPLGPVLIGLGVVGYVAWNQEWRTIRFFLNPVGLALFFVLGLSWPIAAYQANPQISSDWFMHHVDRFRGRMTGGEKPPLFYLYIAPAMILPWTPAAVWATVRGVRSGRFSLASWRWLAMWFLPGLLLLSLSVWKHKHYLIPLLPPTSVLAAVGVVEHIGLRQRRPRPYPRWLSATAIAGGAIAVPSLFIAQGAGAWPFALLALAVACGTVAAFEFANRRRPTAQLVAIMATVLIASILVEWQVMPRHDSYRCLTELAARTNRRLPPGEPLYLLAMYDSQITYYLEAPLKRVDDAVNYLPLMTSRETPSGWIVAPQHVAETLAELRAVEVLDQCSQLQRMCGPRDRVTLFRVGSFHNRSLQAREAVPPDSGIHR